MQYYYKMMNFSCKNFDTKKGLTFEIDEMSLMICKL